MDEKYKILKNSTRSQISKLFVKKQNLTFIWLQLTRKVNLFRSLYILLTLAPSKKKFISFISN